MDDEQWTELYDKAEGIVKENYRKTFIMRWNTDISSYKLSEFEDAMEDFFDEGFYYDWSIWDYQKAHIGDRFYIHPERTPLLLTTDELTEAIPDSTGRKVIRAKYSMIFSRQSWRKSGQTISSGRMQSLQKKLNDKNERL